MTPLLQFRIWSRESSGAERGFVALVGFLLLALAAWAFVPLANNGGGEGFAPASTGVAAGSAAPSTEAPVVAGASVDAGAGASPTSAVATPVAGARPAAGGAVRSVTGATAAGPVTTTAPAAAGDCTGVKTASDQGVTPSELHVAFAEVNVVGAVGSAAVFNFRQDIDQVIDAYVDATNRAGGAGCRRIVAHKYKVNPLDQNDQRAKCLQATQTDKVFAFIDSFTMLYQSTQACVTIENRVPYISFQPLYESFVQKAYPYSMSPIETDNQAVKNWVRGANELGFFDPAKGFRKLGIVDDSCEPEVNADLKTALGALRVPISEFTLGCDPVAPSDQVQQAVLQHAMDGATHVFAATSPTNMQAYLKLAKSQLYTPKYGASDFWGITDSGVTSQFDQDQWDGTIGITSTRNGELATGKPLSPTAAACSRALADHGLKPIDNEVLDTEALAICDDIHLLVETLRHAGLNPARPTLGANIGSVGQVVFGHESDGLYNRARKMTGADFVATVRWQKDCTCEHQIQGFRPSVA